MELFITSHHSFSKLWKYNIVNWRDYKFESKINIITDNFNQNNYSNFDKNVEIYIEKGNWTSRLLNVLKSRKEIDYVLLTTDDIFLRDKKFHFLLEEGLSYLKKNGEKSFSLAYGYNRIIKKKFGRICQIDNLSPHLISLRPTIYNSKFLLNMTEYINNLNIENKTAAAFELHGSLYCQKYNFSSFGYIKKDSLKCEEGISKGEIKRDISTQLRKILKPHFKDQSSINLIKYYFFLLIKELTDKFVPSFFMKFLIKKKYFWSIYEK